MSDEATNVTESCCQSERIACLLGGGLLLGIGLRGGTLSKAIGLVTGGLLIARGIRGHLGVAKAIGAQADDSTEPSWRRAIHVSKTLTVMRPREEVYAYWRNFENLPNFMRHLNEVKVETERLSHWKAKAPAGREVAWDAEITQEVENSLIAWRSLGGADVPNEGEVQFVDAPGGRGTEVRVRLTYHPPAGVIGAVVAKAFGEEPEMQISEDLTRFKSIMETGEVPTTEGQPSERMRRAKGWLGARLLGPGMSDEEAIPNAREAEVL